MQGRRHLTFSTPATHIYLLIFAFLHDTFTSRVRCITARLTVCMDKRVQIIIRMRTPSSQLRLVEFRKRRWVGSIRNTEDIIHSIILIPILHHSLTIRCKIHHLQTFTLLVICIGGLRAVTEFRIDRMTLLVVTYPINNNALTSLFIARKANYLPCRM